MREKVLSRMLFVENVIMILLISICCVLLIESFVPGLLDPSLCFGLSLMFFLVGLGALKFVKLYKRKKSLITEPSEALVYEHTMLYGKKSKSDSIYYCVTLLIWILICFFQIRRLQHDDTSFWFTATAWVLLGIFWVIKACRFSCGFWDYEPKTTITLYKRKLNVSYPIDENYLDSVAAFSINEIASARIVTTKDPEIKHVINEQWGSLTIRTNKKIKKGPYMYAFFLSDSFPLSNGHQAVDLLLRNGRHVLIETDDAENFLVVLRENWIGGVDG